MHAHATPQLGGCILQRLGQQGDRAGDVFNDRTNDNALAHVTLTDQRDQRLDGLDRSHERTHNITSARNEGPQNPQTLTKRPNWRYCLFYPRRQNPASFGHKLNLKDITCLQTLSLVGRTPGIIGSQFFMHAPIVHIVLANKSPDVHISCVHVPVLGHFLVAMARSQSGSQRQGEQWKSTPVRHPQRLPRS